VNCLILKHWNPGLGERLAHALSVIPPVVIAEHRKHAQRRVQALQFAGNCLRLDESAAADAAAIGTADHEIAQQHDESRILRVRSLDDLAELFKPHMGRSDVQIAQYGHFDVVAPARCFQPYMAGDQQARLDFESPQRDQQRRYQDRYGDDSDPGFSAEQLTGYRGAKPSCGKMLRTCPAANASSSSSKPNIWSS